MNSGGLEGINAATVWGSGRCDRAFTIEDQDKRKRKEAKTKALWDRQWGGYTQGYRANSVWITSLQTVGFLEMFAIFPNSPFIFYHGWSTASKLALLCYSWNSDPVVFVEHKPAYGRHTLNVPNSHLKKSHPSSLPADSGACECLSVKP